MTKEQIRYVRTCGMRNFVLNYKDFFRPDAIKLVQSRALKFNSKIKEGPASSIVYAGKWLFNSGVNIEVLELVINPKTRVESEIKVIARNLLQDNISTVEIPKIVKSQTSIPNFDKTIDVVLQYAETFSEEELSEYPEGETKDRIIRTRVRNKVLREKAVKEYGYKCQICGLDTEARYGDHAVIHIHHKNQLSESGEVESTINDVAALCPTCHAVVHSKRPAFTIQEVKKIISKK